MEDHYTSTPRYESNTTFAMGSPWDFSAEMTEVQKEFFFSKVMCSEEQAESIALNTVW